MKRLQDRILRIAALALASVAGSGSWAAAPATRPEFEPDAIHSPWEDLLEGVKTRSDWAARRPKVRRQFLELIRDQHKPPRPALDLQVHESVEVDGLYTRRLVSYAVGEGERAHAYLAIPARAAAVHGQDARATTDGQDARATFTSVTRWPAVLVLHGTTERGKEQAAALSGNPTRAYLDQLARRGYVVLAPDHFVAGHRVPPEGAYVTRRFHERHPEWTAVGKFTFEHSIAIDVLASLPEANGDRIGVMGHSLGGQGTLFLAAYDERVACAAANCTAGTFRQNPRVLDWSRDRWYVYFKHLRSGLLEGKLPPIDFHHVMALVAPRPLLDISAMNDGIAGTQRQRVLMDMKVMDLFQLLGAARNFSFYVNGYGHDSPYETRELMYAWLDAHLKPAAVTRPALIK